MTFKKEYHQIIHSIQNYFASTGAKDYTLTHVLRHLELVKGDQGLNIYLESLDKTNSKILTFSIIVAGLVGVIVGWQLRGAI